jgi:hypothetical protein
MARLVTSEYSCPQGYCGIYQSWIITGIDAHCDGLNLVGGNFTEYNDPSSLTETCLDTWSVPANSLSATVDISPNEMSGCVDEYWYCLPVADIPANGCTLSYFQQYRYMDYNISFHEPSYTFIHCTNPVNSATFNRK